MCANCFEMVINEENIEKAIEILRSSKGKKVLLAVKNLEDDSSVPFIKVPKQECEDMIRKAETIASAVDDFVHQLRLFSEYQPDVRNIKPIGEQRTILLDR